MVPIPPKVIPPGAVQVVFAKDQPQYEQLPGLVNPQTGVVTTEWEFTAAELAAILARRPAAALDVDVPATAAARAAGDRRMNHQQRARNAVRRVLAPRLHTSDLAELLELEVMQALRRAERDGWRSAVRRSAAIVGEIRRGQIDVAARDLLYSARLRVLELEKDR